jgi:hypothetical protein
MAEDDPIAVLERWVDHGAQYGVIELTPARASVELRTCYGEPVDTLVSSDRRFVEYLRSRQGAGQS